MDLNEIKELIDKAQQTKLDCPICIPSYKFRKDAWLVHHLDELEAKVYLFVYEDDYIESAYDKHKWSDNVSIIKISQKDFNNLNLRWRGIQPKRRFIQLFMKNLGITKYFMLDDDIKCGLYPSEKRKNNCGSFIMSQMTVNNLLKSILYYQSNFLNDCNILGLDITCFANFSKLKGFKKEKHVGGLYLFSNNSVLFNDNEFHEDTDLLLNSLDISKIGILDFLSVTFNCKNNTVVENNHSTLHLNDYIAHPNYIDLKIKNELIISHINVKNVKNRSKNYDKNLYEIVLTKDFNKIKKYLENQNKKLNNIDEW